MPKKKKSQKGKMSKNLSTKGKYIHNVKYNSTHSVVDDEEPYKFFCA